MAVLNERAQAQVGGRGFGSYFAVAVVMAAIGAGVALGITELTDGSEATLYNGPMVERSVAMDENIDVLARSAYAQQAGALGLRSSDSALHNLDPSTRALFGSSSTGALHGLDPSLRALFGSRYDN